MPTAHLSSLCQTLNTLNTVTADRRPVHRLLLCPGGCKSNRRRLPSCSGQNPLHPSKFGPPSYRDSCSSHRLLPWTITSVRGSPLCWWPRLDGSCCFAQIAFVSSLSDGWPCMCLRLHDSFSSGGTTTSNVLLASHRLCLCLCASAAMRAIVRAGRTGPGV